MGSLNETRRTSADPQCSVLLCEVWNLLSLKLYVKFVHWIFSSNFHF